MTFIKNKRSVGTCGSRHKRIATPTGKISGYAVNAERY